jgi:hypothetical protein
MTRHRRRHRRRQTRKQNQRGGSVSYGYTGPAFSGPGGVPVESRTADDIYTNPVQRPVQWGGCGCGLQHAMTGGHRPYGFDLTDNSLGKTYSSLTTLPCSAQRGGGGASDAQLLGITSARAGFGMGHPVTTPSASFLEPVPYGSGSLSGGRRRRRRHSHRRHRRR